MKQQSKNIYGVVFIVIAIFIVAAFSGCGGSSNPTNPTSNRTLIGTWRFEDGSIIVFKTNGQCYHDSCCPNGEDYCIGTCSMNYSVNPHHLDWIDYRGTFLLIFEFIDDNTVRIEDNRVGTSRPTCFGCGLSTQIGRRI